MFAATYLGVAVVSKPTGTPFLSVFVDYAHTPDALACLLKALRPHTEGSLHLVFGCGGERDSAKRSDMGRLAWRLADVVLVTDDNPRGEEPGAIRRAVLEGCDRGVEVNDRGCLGSCNGRGIVRFRRVQRLPCGELLTLRRSYEDIGLLFTDHAARLVTLLWTREGP